MKRHWSESEVTSILNSMTALAEQTSRLVNETDRLRELVVRLHRIQVVPEGYLDDVDQALVDECYAHYELSEARSEVNRKVAEQEASDDEQ